MTGDYIHPWKGYLLLQTRKNNNDSVSLDVSTGKCGVVENSILAKIYFKTVEVLEDKYWIDLTKIQVSSVY